jgi:hypothetical protein
MNTPTAHPLRRRPAATTDRIRLRADFPAIKTRPRLEPPREPDHDFLVPNPRPDLTDDAHFLRMLEGC